MKVKLNEYEFWEINLKTVYEPQEFLTLVERFNDQAKMIKKDFLNTNDMLSPESNTKTSQPLDPLGLNKINRNRDNKIIWTRDLVLEMLELNYFGSYKEREDFSKRLGKSWNLIKGNTFNLRIKFDIKPKEVGLKSFPTVGWNSPEKIKQLKL